MLHVLSLVFPLLARGNLALRICSKVTASGGPWKLRGVCLTLARAESLPHVVAEAKLAKAIAAAGKDFMGKWSKSMKE